MAYRGLWVCNRVQGSELGVTGLSRKGYSLLFRVMGPGGVVPSNKQCVLVNMPPQGGVALLHGL